MFWSILNQPSQEEVEAARRKKKLQEIQQVEELPIASRNTAPPPTTIEPIKDSVSQASYESQFGIWSSAIQGTSQQVSLSNEVMTVVFDTKGGTPRYIELKDYTKQTFNKKEQLIKTEQLRLLEDKKNKWNLQLRKGVYHVNTEDLFFSVKKSDASLVFRATASNGAYIEQTFSLSPSSYEIEYDITLRGLSSDVSQEDGIKLEIVNYMDKIEKNSIYESRFSTVYFKAEDEDYDYCSCTGDDVEELDEEKIDWASFSNQFFNISIISKGRLFDGLRAETRMLDKDDEDLKYTSVLLDIPFDGGTSETFSLSVFTGPNEFKMLKAYGNGLEQIIPFGRSIFGTINRYVIRPAFDFLAGFIGSKGLVIIILIFIIKMALYPLTYKMLHSQAKMGALKPRLASLKEKYKSEPQKQQMETMKIYREYGVSPFGGCMPMVVQMPIWYALFRFFPASITFRQEPFLWASDLSSYDVLFNIPFEIPAFGSHVSLFTILWAITTVIYTYYNSQHMDMSSQPAMKYVQYLMPLMFFAFFNNYASGLTCYMFFSQLFTIAQTVITKKFVFDDEKLLAELDIQKAKPKKKNSFMQKLQEAQEKQQRMQEMKEKDKRKNKKKK